MKVFALFGEACKLVGRISFALFVKIVAMLTILSMAYVTIHNFSLATTSAWPSTIGWHDALNTFLAKWVFWKTVETSSLYASETPSQSRITDSQPTLGNMGHSIHHAMRVLKYVGYDKFGPISTLCAVVSLLVIGAHD